MRPLSDLVCKGKLFPLLLLALSPAKASAAIEIDPQFVVNRILGEGRDARNIELDALSAYTAYYNTFAIYDLGLVGRGSYEDNQNQYLSGGGNLRDRTSIYELAVSKRIPTGTTFSVGYSRTTQNSTFRNSSIRPGYIVFDEAEIKITQDLLGNFFGIGERMNNRAAEQAVAQAQLLKKERQEELVLSSLRLFWDSYVSREALKEATAQRDKYEELVREVENKTRVGFANAGDLPKARAELGAQIRNVKSSSYVYLSNLDKLLTAMRMEDADRDVRFVLREEVPPLPAMNMPMIDSLRTVQVAQDSYEVADLKNRATNLATNWPELKLIGTAGYTGLDESKDRAFASVTGGDKPRYGVALELNYKFFSQGRRASLNSTDVDFERARNNFDKAKEDIRQQISTAMENVRFTHAAALSAIEEAKNWEAAVKAQERNYRQGRLDFSQLIQDYNSYFRSRATRIRAIGDYQIALHNYASIVDELVK